jgi:hypothetical protein
MHPHNRITGLDAFFQLVKDSFATFHPVSSLFVPGRSRTYSEIIKPDKNII